MMANPLPGRPSFYEHIGQPFPEVFNTVPPPPTERKPGQLAEELIRRFFEEGFVVVENFFSSQELDPCREDINVLVDNLAKQLYQAGKTKSLYNEVGFFKRLICLENDFPGANIVLLKQANARMPQAFQDLWSNERLLNVVEQLIGPEIAGHPVWNLRTKTPHNDATTVPWHQDSAYLDNRSYNVLQPTAWIPLLDANENNGCMQVVRKGHKTGKVATHQCCAGPTWYIMLDEAEMEKTLDVNMAEDCVICPVPYGGMLLINNLIPHRSLQNYSDSVRWSLDLRWQDPLQPYGFYDLKEGLLLRSPKNPDMKIDWEFFNSIDRHYPLESREEKKITTDPFDTTLPGPWMKRWEIVHENRHTATLENQTMF